MKNILALSLLTLALFAGCATATTEEEVVTEDAVMEEAEPAVMEEEVMEEATEEVAEDAAMEEAAK